MGARQTKGKKTITPAKARGRATGDSQNGANRDTPDQATPDYQAMFQEVVERANQGERLAIDRLRAFLDVNPHLWQRVGDLTAVAERVWVELIAGHDVLSTESVRRRLAQM